MNPTFRLASAKPPIRVFDDATNGYDMHHVSAALLTNVLPVNASAPLSMSAGGQTLTAANSNNVVTGSNGNVISPGYDVVTLEASGVADVAFSPDQTLLYASKTNGDIDVFNVASHQLIATWHTGTVLGAISVSPDGTSLIAVERQSPQGLAVIYQVNTATGTANSYSMSGANFNDVQITDGNTAILAGGGQSTITSFDMTTKSFSHVAGGVEASPWDSFVKDGNYTSLSIPSSKWHD